LRRRGERDRTGLGGQRRTRGKMVLKKGRFLPGDRHLQIKGHASRNLYRQYSTKADVRQKRRRKPKGIKGMKAWNKNTEKKFARQKVRTGDAEDSTFSGA